MNEKKGLVPRLRFPEFLEAGEWKTQKIGDVCYILQGYGFPEVLQGRSDGAFPFCKVSDISVAVNQCGGLLGKAANYISPEDMQELGAKLVPKGSTVFAKIGEALRLNRRAITTRECLIDNNAVALKGKPKEVSDYFLYLLSQKVDLGEYCGGAVPSVNKSILSEIPTTTPSSKEQQKIADCLYSLDALITAQADKLDALKTHKKGLMQQLFPREGETVPRLRFPNFREAGEWEKTPLSESVESLDAGVSVNSGDRPANADEKGILKTSAVTDGVFDPAENKVVSDIDELKRLKESVIRDTVIVSRMNTPALVGANAYIDRDHGNLFLPDRLWAAKAKPEASMRFIAYILGSGKGRAALSALATGTSGSMKNITKASVLELQILTPEPEEQRKIANCLSSLDALIAAQAEKLNALKIHKQGLMQKLFPNPEAVAA